MSRSVVGLVVALGLLLSACAEQPTEVSPPGAEAAPSSAAVATCTTGRDEVLALINQVIPRGPLRASVAALVNALPRRAQDRIKLVVRNRIFVIQDLILRAFYAGRLNGGTSDETFDKVLELIEALYRYVCLTPPDFPDVDEESDIVAGVVFPNSPTTTLVVPSGNAAVTIPAGAAPAPTTIVVRILPDSPVPLHTTLNQFPLFYEFSGTTATGPVEFNQAVTAGVCLRNNPDEGVNLDDLRLAHNIDRNFGDVEVLPLVDGPEVPGLDCSDVPEAPAGQIGAARRAGLGFLEQALAPLSRALLPKPLSATTLLLATLGVGGTTRKFSPFGVVDIESNPGSLLRLSPAESEEEGGSTVTRTVRVTSANDTPIANVPVTFSADGGTVGGPQPVLTNADGEASASWTLPEESGDYTLTATVPAVDNAPSGLAPPGGNVLFLPDVAFDSTSVTFTATVAAPIELTAASGDGQTGFANQLLTAPLVVLATEDGEAREGVRVSFVVTDGGGSVAPAVATTNALGLAEVNWTLGPTLGGQAVSASAPGAAAVTFTANATQPPPARIVLQWGASPPDLDSHLTGPGGIHVFYASPCHPGPLTGCQATEQEATLDRDDVDGRGPETITIEEQALGTYRFSVHDFTNLNASPEIPSSALGASGATVTLYLASGVTHVFDVPDGEGTLWTVFELTGTEVEEIGTLEYAQPGAATAAASVFGRLRRALPTDRAVIQDAVGRHGK